MSAVYEKNDGTQNELRENVSAKLKGVRKLEPIHINKVLVIGLGQLGLPVARYVNERGLDVYGYDISSEAMERAEKTTGIKQAANFSGFDAYIICVSTHKQEDMFSPQIDGILSIVERLSKEAKDGALVSIESTIPLGTSKKVSEILNHRLHVVHAPHRWYTLEEKEHGVNQLRVVGGVRDCCLRVAMQFYDGSGSKIDNVNSVTAQEHTDYIHILDANYHERNIRHTHAPSTEVEIAELTKIIENAHRYLQIAFAEIYIYTVKEIT